jgi:glycosyltransferase involved in cell wall biosynthesis
VSAEDEQSSATRRPRVLLVIKCLGYGGAERLLLDFVAHRTSASFDYEVAYVLERENALVPAVEETGVRVHCLGARGNWDLRWLFGLRRLVRKGRFVVVHAHLPMAASLARLAVASLPPKQRPVLVYTEHSMWDKMAVLVKALNRATVGLDDALVVVSESAREVLPPSLRKGARVVVHGVDLTRSAEMLARREELARAVRREFGVPTDEPLVVTVANFRPEKAYDVLLPALRKVVDSGTPLRLVAVGRGPLREEVERATRSLGLEDRVLFAGERADALEIVAGSDVFVLASRQEGLPVALMEAVSVGIPVVATEVGEIPRLMRSEADALLVAPEDPDALAGAISRVVSDAALRERLGQASLRLSSLFDVEKATKEIEGLYTELLDAGRRSAGAQDR